MRVAREGLPFIAIGVVLAGAGIWLATARPSIGAGALAAVLTLVAAWIV